MTLDFNKEGILKVKMHDFKNNISRYIRYMRAGRMTMVLVYRHRDPVGLFVPYVNGDFINPYDPKFVPDPKAVRQVEYEELIAEMRKEKESHPLPDC